MKNDHDKLPAITVGQILYRERYKKGAAPEIEEVTVFKTGRKYFYLDGWETRYPIDNKTLAYTNKEYSQNNFQLYRTKQEILDKNERFDLIGKLKLHFGLGGGVSKNSLEQLQSAAKILGILETPATTILDRIKLWQRAPLSLVCDDLFELGYCCTIKYSPHNCESGKWISVTIEKDDQKWGGIGGSTKQIARNRLVEWADRAGIREPYMA